MGHRSDASPAGMEIVRHLLPPIGKVRRVEHHVAVPWAEVPALVAELQKRESVSAKSLTFTILAAARAGEVIGATWDDTDLATRTWVIPETRTEAERAPGPAERRGGRGAGVGRRRPEWVRLSWPEARSAAVQHGDVAAAPEDARRRLYGARFSLVVPRLVRRAGRASRGRRGGAGACRAEQG